MTPREQAKIMVIDFEHVEGQEQWVDYGMAIDCARRAVKYTIFALESLNGLGWDELQFWKEVKREIEKL